MAINGNQRQLSALNGTQWHSMEIERPRSPIVKSHRLCRVSWEVKSSQVKAHRLCRVSWEGADVALSAATAAAVTAAAAAAAAAAAGCTTSAMAATHHAQIGDHLPYQGGCAAARMSRNQSQLEVIRGNLRQSPGAPPGAWR